MIISYGATVRLRANMSYRDHECPYVNHSGRVISMRDGDEGLAALVHWREANTSCWVKVSRLELSAWYIPRMDDAEFFQQEREHCQKVSQQHSNGWTPEEVAEMLLRERASAYQRGVTEGFEDAHRFRQLVVKHGTLTTRAVIEHIEKAGC